MVEDKAVRVDGIEVTLGAVVGFALAYYLVSHYRKTGSMI